MIFLNLKNRLALKLFFLLLFIPVFFVKAQVNTRQDNNFIQRETNSCATELIISEYIEGSSNNKYIEIYNGTGNVVNMGDYEVRIYFNGNTSYASISLNAVNLADGNVYVLANASADIWSGTPDQTSSSLNFNGNDAIELFNITTGLSVDIIGKIGEDPGNQWGSGLTSTEDNTIVRKTTVLNGDTNGADAFDPTIEWDGYDQDNISHLGSHTMSCTPCLEPTTNASFHLNSPQNITTNSVTLNWNSGDGTNRIVVMSTNPITFLPLDNQTYSANTSYGSGTLVAANTFVVYNGNLDTVDVTGLIPGTFYYTKIFEYNCNVGSEDYLTTGTIAEDAFYVKPEKPNTFTKVCSTNDSISLEWTAPTNGVYDGFLLVVREGASPHSVNSIDPSSIVNANTDYSVAGQYGSSSPNSRFLYVGNNLNTTITNLAQGVTYTFKIFAYSNNGIQFKYSNGKTLTRTILLDDVINPLINGADTQATLNWTNVDNACFDEVLVVVNETAGINFTPTGDGTSYTPNTVYSSINQVVYLANGNSVTVTNLINGTTYYFEIFVRIGTSWSSGVEVAVTPNAPTLFKAGDMVIVGYDNKVGTVDDVVTILTFVDMQPNTTFWYANATYEVGAPANVRTEQWKSCKTTPNALIGSQQFTYLGPDVLPAGSTFCITIGNNQVLNSDFIVHQSSGSGTYNFSDGFIPAGFTSSLNISISNPDAIFLMQGSWSADLGGYRTFSGVVLGGIQDGGNWYDISDDLSALSGNANRISRIPPDIQCFAVQGTTVAGKGYAYYNGTRNDTHIALLSEINDFSTNWIQDVGTDANDISGNSCDASYTFTISGTATPGIWTNAKNDNNWFNCGNWENLTVPDQTIDVQINTLSGLDQAVIDDTATDADIYTGIASCKSLNIAGEKVVIEGDTNDVLKVYGNLTITNGQLDMDDGDTTTDDGKLFLYGNWTNVSENNFLEGNSSVIFKGSNMQTVSCNTGTETEKFYNLTMDNPNGVTFLSSNIYAINDLHIINSSSPITATPNHYILAGNRLLNDNNTKFIIQNEASFVQFKTGADNNTGSDNTTFTIKKQTTPYVMYDYTYWSSPIKSANIGTVFSANNPNYIFEFVTQNFYDAFSGNGYPQTIAGADSHDDNGDDWNLASGVMTKGKGYAIMGEGAVFPFIPPTATTFTQNVDFVGNINNGLINVNVYKDKYNTDNGVGDAFNKNDNLLGNPYPSAIDASVFLTNNSNLGGTIYFWTHDSVIGSGSNIGPDAYNFTNDDYASWNSTGGTAAHANGVQPTGKIASGQGFMVTATVNETIHFDNDMRVLQENNNFYRTNRIWLNLTNNQGLFRQILIAFDSNATDGLDRLYDGARMENGDNYDFYSLLGDKKMGIQALSPFQTEKIVPLGFENIAQGSFTISINNFESDFDTIDILLKDNYLNTYHNLKEADYIFSASQLGNINNRFELVFQKNSLSITNSQVNDNQLIISSNQDGLITLTNTKRIAFSNIEFYDVMGRKVYGVKNVYKNIVYLHLNITSGVYICKAILNDKKQYVKKIILK